MSAADRARTSSVPAATTASQRSASVVNPGDPGRQVGVVPAGRRQLLGQPGEVRAHGHRLGGPGLQLLAVGGQGRRRGVAGGQERVERRPRRRDAGRLGSGSRDSGAPLDGDGPEVVARPVPRAPAQDRELAFVPLDGRGRGRVRGLRRLVRPRGRPARRQRSPGPVVLRRTGVLGRPADRAVGAVGQPGGQRLDGHGGRSWPPSSPTAPTARSAARPSTPGRRSTTGPRSPRPTSRPPARPSTATEAAPRPRPRPSRRHERELRPCAGAPGTGPSPSSRRPSTSWNPRSRRPPRGGLATPAARRRSPRWLAARDAAGGGRWPPTGRSCRPAPPSAWPCARAWTGSPRSCRRPGATTPTCRPGSPG